MTDPIDRRDAGQHPWKSNAVLLGAVVGAGLSSVYAIPFLFSVYATPFLVLLPCVAPFSIVSMLLGAWWGKAFAGSLQRDEVRLDNGQAAWRGARLALRAVIWIHLIIVAVVFTSNSPAVITLIAIPDMSFAYLYCLGVPAIIGVLACAVMGWYLNRRRNATA